MDSSKIFINGIGLDIILRHYRAIDILIEHSVKTKKKGGDSALQKWDDNRTDKSKIIDVVITIKPDDSGLISIV
jgi:hypothetical protein